jgi:putative two-component system response regulator
MGAVDYIVKPIKPAVMLARVHTHLALKLARDQLAHQNQWLEIELARRLNEVQLAQDLTLAAMAELAETRDHETGHHILRTQSYVEALGRHLQADPTYAGQLSETQLRHIVKAAPMHDIGKIGIPDAILLKPGRLSAAEWAVMQTHAQIGGDAIGQAVQKALAQHPPEPGTELPESVRFLQVAQRIATHHHERWDGSGYPAGLAGDAIPLAARLMALADVFDALTTPRVYKRPWSIEEAVTHIQSQSGSHFDPTLVAAMVAILPQFEAIAHRLADPDPDPEPDPALAI